jgi:type III restriction enzyme
LTIFADEAKRRFDIVIPQLTRALARSDSALSELHPGDVPDPKRRLAVPDVQPDEYIRYRGRHLIEKGVIEEYGFHVPYAEDPSGVITYYTRSAARAGGVERLSGAFATLAPMVRDYLKERVFQRPVELEDKVILRRLAENDAQALVTGAFGEAIRSLAITESEPTITESAFRVSDTPPFPWSRQTVEGERTVFNLTPVDNALEARFAQFLDRASDVAAWAKLTMNSRFALEYISKAGALRYYYPDFVVRMTDDSCLIVETKGQEDLDVALKDRRAGRWCVDATRLAGREWAYEKVSQHVFDAYTGGDLDGLRRFIAASGGSKS